MKEIPVSQFKSNCSSLIAQVRKTRRPIRITLRGKAIAEIIPIPSKGEILLGRMKGKRTLSVISSLQSLIWTT